MNAKYTPGPLSIRKTGPAPRYLIETGNGTHIGTTFTHEDALLYSAAPDLLEACKEILRRLSTEDGQSGQCWLCSDALHPTDDDKTIVDYLRDILAKAEGK